MLLVALLVGIGTTSILICAALAVELVAQRRETSAGVDTGESRTDPVADHTRIM